MQIDQYCYAQNLDIPDVSLIIAMAGIMTTESGADTSEDVVMIV